MPEIVGPNWESKLVELVSESQNQFTLVTPYVKEYGADVILSNLSSKTTLRSILSISKADLVRGSSDYEAVVKLAQRGDSRYLPGLHAKIYLSDSRGLVTSGNLTRAGLIRNTEYGVLIDETNLHKQLSSEIDELWKSASPFHELPAIEKVQKELKKLQDLQSKFDYSISEPYLDSIFQQPLWLESLQKAAKPFASAIPPSVIEQSILNIENVIQGYTERFQEIDSHEVAKDLRRRLRRTKFVFLDRDKDYSMQDLYSYAKLFFGEFCDDSYLCDHDPSPHRPEWQHQVRWAFQDLKEQGFLIPAGNHKWRFTDDNTIRWSRKGQKTDQTCIEIIHENPDLLSLVRMVVSNDEIVRWTDALIGVAPQWRKQGETDQIWMDKYQTRIPLLRRLIEALERLTSQTGRDQKEIWCALRAIQYELGLQINMNPVKLGTIYQIIERYDDLEK